MDQHLLKLKEASNSAAREYHGAVSVWLCGPRTEELGNICLRTAYVYRDRLNEQLAYLLSLESAKSRDEDLVRTVRVIELISVQIEVGFDF
jgi:hypothetical protein